MNLKLFSGGSLKAIDDKRRVIEHVISAQIVDRDGEVLISKGAQVDAYLDSNPVVFLNHAHRELPVAKSLAVEPADLEVTAITKFAGIEQLHTLAEITFRLYRDKFMNAWSVGFRPITFADNVKLPGQTGRTIHEWELLEYSAVGIPANPAAKSALVSSLRTKGFLSLPDGASETDLGKALGEIPLRSYWQIASDIFPALVAGSPRKRKDDAMSLVSRDEVAELFKAAIQPVLDKVADLEHRQTQGDLRATKATDTSEHFIDGRPFPFGGDGRKTGPGRLTSRGEPGLSLRSVIRSLQMGDRSLAPLAWDLSAKLVQSGYVQSDPRSILIPLGDASLFRVPGHEATIDDVGRQCKQAYQLDDVDPAEVAIARKQWRTKAPMDPLDDTLGGSLIALPFQGEPILALRAATVVLQAGARGVPAPPQGSIVFPRTTGEPSLEWLAPNQPITESTQPTGQLTLTPKKCAGLVKLPNELIRFSQGIAEALVREALVSKMARTIDLAALEGLGGSAQPLGIINSPLSAANTPTAGFVTKYTGAGVSTTLGNSLRAEDPLRMIAMIEEGNSLDGPTGWIMRPLMFAGLANKRADAVVTGDGAGAFLFPVTRGDLGNAVRKELSGVGVYTSTSVSKTRTENNGAVTGLTYVLVGDFRQLLIANIGVVELVMSSEAGFGADQAWIRIVGHVDSSAAYNEAFCLYDQILIPA